MTSFRKVVRHLENAYLKDEEEDEWHVPEDIYCFPTILKGHKELGNVWELPEIVEDIYTQTVEAIKNNLNILAGIGLRATIEAICNERTIRGKDLDERIDRLFKAGLISQTDADRLHAIRFLGNDAAHETKNTSQKNLLTALRIIEHLLLNIYILDSAAEGKLATIIKNSSEFLLLLENKLDNFSSGDEITLTEIIGKKEIRRLGKYFDEHEQYLVDKIKSGAFPKLALGKIDVTSNPEKKHQYFIVQAVV